MCSNSMLGMVTASLRAASLLGGLAVSLGNGVVPFSKCAQANKKEWEKKIVYMDRPDRCSIARQYEVLKDAGGAATTYGRALSEICGLQRDAINAVVEDIDTGQPCIRVSIPPAGPSSGTTEIIIKGGHWYTV